MTKTTRVLSALALAVASAAAITIAGVVAQEETAPVWPVHYDLVAKRTTGPLKVGDIRIWNTDHEVKVEVTALPGYQLEAVNMWTANDLEDPLLDAKPDPATAPYKGDFQYGVPQYTQVISLPTFQLKWGKPFSRDRYVIVHAELKGIQEAAFAIGTPFYDLKGKLLGYYATYQFAKVETGHFVDAKVRGLAFWTPTQNGTTGNDGNFFYIPGERVNLSVGNLPLGDAFADHTLSPTDLFPGSDLDDNRVLNMARVLQSLDSDPQAMILDVRANTHCVNTALAALGLTAVDFGDDAQIDPLLTAMQTACPLLPMVYSKDVARANLDQGQQSANLLRTNVSKNPEMASDKAKIEIMPFYVPALKADGTATSIVYHDDAGNVIETRYEAKPIVVTYEEEVEGTSAGLDMPNARDIFVAISRDDGSTWKRTNISKTAGRTSKITSLGTAAPAPGESNKPMLAVKDNLMLLAWTDKYCHGGRPAYSITLQADINCDSNGDGVNDGVEKVSGEGTSCVPDYAGDDAYWKDDIYGVGGPQRSVLYDAVDWPDLGEVPYSCVWTARGKIESNGNIVWFKPERLTSGRRDATQLVAAAAEDTGVALAWQEDPKGLQPPSEYGPGDGWSGASVSNKTDIWYSFITWTDFDKVDTAYPVSQTRGEEDIVDTDAELSSRVKALVPFSLPVKVTDNDVCSLETMAAEGGAGDGEDLTIEDLAEHLSSPGTGTHRYCGDVVRDEDGIPVLPLALKAPTSLCAYTIPITNHNGVTHHVCVAADANPDLADSRLFDGNTGASRVNLFLQPYMKSDGTKSAWVTLAYEESKGVGIPPEEEGEDDDRYKPDLGKNVIYHSFDYTKPDTVSGGFVVNLPETDAAGLPVYVKNEDGTLYFDALGRPQFAYENARRVRVLQQPKSKAGLSKTVLVALWRQGEDGHGKAADIFMRRLSILGVKLTADDNPYSSRYFSPAVQNVSSVQPGEIRTYDVLDESTNNMTTITKMVNWTWEPKNLADKSAAEPYSDAKAHRGSLNGDELIIGYTWTPNWGRLAKDKYDLYVRRSWDGGQSWKTDPNGSGPIQHTIVFVDPETKEETVTITDYLPGSLEPPRNISNIRNNLITVLEPRIVKTPGTILRPDGTATGYAEDIQASGIYQVAWGIEVNSPGSASDDDDEVPFKMPLDIYYGRTTDKGQNYEKVFVTRSDGSGSVEEGWNLLAKDKPEQAGAQIKQTPDGSRMYAIWVEKGDGGSDIMFRRVDYRK